MSQHKCTDSSSLLAYMKSFYVNECVGHYLESDLAGLLRRMDLLKEECDKCQNLMCWPITICTTNRQLLDAIKLNDLLIHCMYSVYVRLRCTS